MSVGKPAAAGRGRRKRSGNAVVYAALAGDLLVACVKFLAAHHTGSSAMLSEGVHSTVDALTELLLLYGLRASQQRPTPKHPIGFGREVFFWNFIVALAILALGAGVALLDGIHQVLRPRPIEAPLVSYGVVAAACVAEVGALFFAVRSGHAVHGRRNFLARVWANRDATLVTVLFSSASGLAGLMVVAFGTFASVALHRPECDGIASIIIAALLAATALFLARASKSLLIGVPASTEKVASILKLVAADPSVLSANGALTIHLAPDQILVALSIAFKVDLTTPQIEAATAQIEDRVAEAHPDVMVFLLKPESVARYQTFQLSRGW